MGILNVIVKHDGTDISNSTISYNREQQICTGIGTLELIVPLNINRTFQPWDVIEIWENGNKKAKFFIDVIQENVREGIINIKATDGSKKLTDYFIVDSYTIDYLSYGRTWIEKFLDEAGVSYTFTVSGNGSPLSNNTSLGFDSAFNTITTLLQQSGWYIYFNENGVAIIGNLNKNVNNPDHVINENDFREIERELDDDRLRNRAVVWGNTNPTYGEVFVDISVPTPWNYDAQDKRAVVLSNSAIFSNDQARTLAIQMLNEFTQIKDEKTLLVLNDYNMKIGEILKVTSKYWSGRGLITGIIASLSTEGLTYLINVNKKCPRLFTFFSNYPDTEEGFYVYIGTAGDGIWRKYTESSTWGNDSSGLEDLNIVDLAIRNGNFATIADDGYLYTRSSELGAWNKYTPPNLRDVAGVTYSNMDLKAAACSTNMNDNIIVGYNYVASGIAASGIIASGISWVLELTGAQTLIRAEQVTISGGAGFLNDQYSIFDLESTGEYNIVSVSGLAVVSGYYTDTVDEYYRTNGGKRYIQTDGWGENIDSESLALGFGYGTHDDISSAVGASGGWGASKLISDKYSDAYWYFGTGGTAPSNGVIVKLDPNGPSTTSWTFTQETEWQGAPPDLRRYLIQRSPTQFEFIVHKSVSDTNHEIWHYSYTLGDSAVTQIGYETHGGFILDDFSSYGTGLIGNELVIQRYSNADGARMYTYNTVSKTLSDTLYFDATAYTTHTNPPVAVTLVNTGNALIGVCAAVIPLDPEYFPSCPVLGSWQWKTIQLWITAYKIDKYGSKSTIGPVVIHTFTEENLPDSLQFWEIGGGLGLNITDVFWAGRASRLSTNTSYLMLEYGIWAGHCSTSQDLNAITGFTFGISVPSLGVFYNKQINGGTWLTYYDSFEPTDASDLMRKTENGYDLTSAWSLSGLSSKYSGTYLFCDRAGPHPQYDEDYEVRMLPAYGTVISTYESYPDIDPVNNPILCDLTGQVPAYVPSDYAPFSKPYNLNYETSRVNISSTAQLVFYTQNVLVGNYSSRWRLYTKSSDVLANYPRGTILKHTSTTNLGSKVTATDESLEQTLGIFEVIKTTQNPCKVDIAQGVPTVIYDVPEQDGLDSDDFAASITNKVDSFYTHADPKPIYESRVFSLPTPGSFPTISGAFNPKDYERYIGISNREGILASEYDLSTPWVNMVTVASGVAVSGLITHFETTNYVPEGTYFFYTVSGVKSFYQKNPEENYWRDYSATLPDSPITIIRVDDFI